MVLEEQADHFEAVVQEHALRVVEDAARKGLEEYGVEEKYSLQWRLWLHEQQHCKHVVHSLPVGHVVLDAVCGNDGCELLAEFRFPRLLDIVEGSQRIEL